MMELERRLLSGSPLCCSCTVFQCSEWRPGFVSTCRTTVPCIASTRSRCTCAGGAGLDAREALRERARRGASGARAAVRAVRQPARPHCAAARRAPRGRGALAGRAALPVPRARRLLPARAARAPARRPARLPLLLPAGARAQSSAPAASASSSSSSTAAIVAFAALLFLLSLRIAEHSSPVTRFPFASLGDTPVWCAFYRHLTNYRSTESELDSFNPNLFILNISLHLRQTYEYCGNARGKEGKRVLGVFG